MSETKTSLSTVTGLSVGVSQYWKQVDVDKIGLSLYSLACTFD